NLKSGVVRTIFVHAQAVVAANAVEQVARILNERLAGLTLREIRASLSERLRDTRAAGGERDLLNIFIAEGDEIFSLGASTDALVLGSAQKLADQPEFASNERMRELLTLTERRDLIKQALATREHGLTITIGGEHGDKDLAGFTLVTSTYRVGDLKGVIGVIGPTRMPYEKVIGLVQHTSRLVEGLIQ
ncbi:MAG TPA: HrcA family transcriptional regulator, partial [Gemmatimonadales bacterium]|nr:HrcA family transcriptional regulator [Gemmatimonadales bacterium]